MKCNVIRARRTDAMSLVDATANAPTRMSMSLIDATVNTTVAAADQTYLVLKVRIKLELELLKILKFNTYNLLSILYYFYKNISSIKY